jgi:large subunit ribosomal protein L19
MRQGPLGAVMVSKIIDQLQKDAVKSASVPAFRIGDTIRVHVKIVEGDKERVQAFAGTVIARDGGGATQTFTVRRVSHGVGVERIFPLYSPHLAKIEVESHARVKRAKLYFLRDRVGKRTKLRTQIRK